MDKLKQLKKLVLELYELGEDEHLDVEDYVEIVMRKVEEAAKLVNDIPDTFSSPPLSKEEVDAIHEQALRLRYDPRTDTVHLDNTQHIGGMLPLPPKDPKG